MCLLGIWPPLAPPPPPPTPPAPIFQTFLRLYVWANFNFFCSKIIHILSESAESAETTDQWIHVALRKILRCAGLADAQN